ncbi:hypothetical protein LZ30DRAFT_780193 [Colletotrichum cereale]|nr:hypothetical protein LZ30DRAFT_780193 [Colletotrichum cereale]
MFPELIPHQSRPPPNLDLDLNQGADLARRRQWHQASPRTRPSAFGLSSFTAGLGPLLRPSGPLASLRLSAANGDGAMGVYCYTLAVARDNRPCFLATAPMRLASAVVFWRQSWVEVEGSRRGPRGRQYPGYGTMKFRRPNKSEMR